jgi:hypothetical protein
MLLKDEWCHLKGMKHGCKIISTFAASKCTVQLRPVYADDVVLIADTERDLQVSVTEWASTFSERGLKVNINKIKVTKICRENEEEKINIQWKQQKLDIVEEITIWEW